jgi:hypothetical protein
MNGVLNNRGDPAGLNLNHIAGRPKPTFSQCNCIFWDVPAIPGGPAVRRPYLPCSAPNATDGWHAATAIPMIDGHRRARYARRMAAAGMAPIVFPGPAVSRNNPPWYDPRDFFWCRRTDHTVPANVSCTECATENLARVEFHVVRDARKILCGRCHTQAQADYPRGHDSCMCIENLVKDTCSVCCE